MINFFIKKKYQKQILFLVFISLSAVLNSCIFFHPIILNQGLSFYIVTAPINSEQSQLTNSFLSMIKGGNSENTKLITSGNSYRVVELCNGDKSSILVPEVKVVNGSDQEKETVVSPARLSATNVISGSKNCNSNSKSLLNIMTNISQAANKEKIVVLIQVPWTEKEIDKSVLSELTKSNLKLSKNTNITKILLFGVDPSIASDLSNSFAPFNQSNSSIFYSPVTLETNQLNMQLQRIRQEILVTKQ